MKKLFILSGLLMLFFSLRISAAMPIDIEVNSKKLAFETAPYISEGTVFVPLRTMSEALGLFCEWNAAKKSASVSDGALKLEFYPFSDIVYTETKAESLEIHFSSDRVFVPIRYLAESFDCGISWDSLYYMISISASSDPPASLIDKSYTQDEVYWLSKIINAEAAGESLKGQIAVGNVILNRVVSSLFPNTIYSVIFDKNGGVQFEPVINGTIHLIPTHSSVKAAKLALSGENTAGESLFFLNPEKAQNFWIVNNRRFFVTIGNHDFYL